MCECVCAEVSVFVRFVFEIEILDILLKEGVTFCKTIHIYLRAGSCNFELTKKIK